MAEPKRTFKDVALQFVRDLINDKPANPATPATATPSPKTLNDLRQEDLEKERTRLDRKEREMMDRIKQIEADKMTLFSEGVKKASEVERAVIARRIKERDDELQSVNSMLQIISKQKRVIHGLILAKERAQILSKSGLVSLGDIALEDLVDQIEELGLEGDVKTDSLDRMLRAMGKSKDLSPKLQEDTDVMDIMKAMERAAAAAETNPEAIQQELRDLSAQKQRSQENPEEESF
ncbi:MAG: hypothetical protein OHK0052_06990 [Anaerolineales bacterium]